MVPLACSVGFLLLCSVPCSFPLSAMTWAMICWKTTSFSSKLIFFLKDTSSSVEEVYNQKSMQQNHRRGEERRGEERREEKRRGKGGRRTGSSVNGDVIMKWRNLPTRTGHV